MKPATAGGSLSLASSAVAVQTPSAAATPFQNEHLTRVA